MGTISTLSGVVKTWSLFGNSRKFSEVTLPYGQATELFMPVRYNAITGKGEQRDINTQHLRKLKLAMENGEYTPTPGSVGLRKKHREAVAFSRSPEGLETFTLPVNSDDPLALTDSGHRMEAIGTIAKELRVKLASAKDEQEKEAIQGHLDEVLSLPITFTIYLDGDTQRDFVNLQAGRTVDAAHLFSLKVQQKVLGDPAFKLAMDVAKLLHKRDDSPFKNLIRFDSRGLSTLPISTLCSKGASDLGTSLVGLAKVGQAASPPFKAEALAECVVAAYKSLKQDAPELLEEKKVLTPPSVGTKGSATMLIGVGIALAHRLSQLGTTTPEPELLASLVSTARSVLDEKVDGGFSGSVKRALMGDFVASFFPASGCEEALHQDIPVSLLRVLSASTYAVSPLPRAKKEAEAAAAPETPSRKGRPRKAATAAPATAVAFDSAQPEPWEPASESESE